MMPKEQCPACLRNIQPFDRLTHVNGASKPASDLMTLIAASDTLELTFQRPSMKADAIVFRAESRVRVLFFVACLIDSCGHNHV